MQGTCKIAVFTHWRTCEWTLLIMSLLFKPECIVQGFHSWGAAETCLFKSSTFPTQCVRYSKKGNRNDEYNCWIFCVGPTIPRFVSKKENPWILRMLKGGSCPPLPLGEGAVYQAWSVNTHTVLAGGLISQNKWKHLRGWIISVQGLKSSAAAVV